MKYIYFQDTPFTSKTAVEAHEQAFKYFEGVTQEVVYDQDRLFLVDENLGELLLTKEFKAYVFEREYKFHFCRKSDPQSKGKVENVVKYVKNNFLYGRRYYDIGILQSQALAWLTRTGNGMPHTTTKKIPLQEWEIEKQYLSSWVTVKLLPSFIMRNVRKDNTIAFDGTFYSVPLGTYNESRQVWIFQQDDELIIHDHNNKFICKHSITNGNGKTIINTDHKRDKSIKISELIKQTAAMFENSVMASEYFELLRKDKGRYIRDQIQAIRQAISTVAKNQVTLVLEKCMTEKYLSANIFKELLLAYQKKNPLNDSSIGEVILLDPACTIKAEIKPDKSDLDAYEEVFNVS